MAGTKKSHKPPVSRRDFLKTIGGGAAGASVASRVFGRDLPAGAAGAQELEIVTRKRIALTVNGKPAALDVEPRETLLAVLRERFRLTGAKRVCNHGECGGCTVLLDGKPVYACHMLAVQADGKSVLTVEGLAADGQLHPVQQAFIDKDGYQCGFCTPGFIMATVGLLGSNPAPGAEEIKAGLSGNLCRCGNYQKIYEAVSAAAETMRRG